MVVGDITKAGTFKSFFHRSYENTQLLFYVTALFSIFMRQALTDCFWGLHKNMNCAFPWKLSVILYTCHRFYVTVLINNNIDT